MPRRLERNGAVEPLTPRFTGFLEGALGGKSLDEILGANEKRADYVCLHGLLAVEIKSLENDASVRLANVTDELEQREDWPNFFGAWPMESVLKNLKDPEPVKRMLAERIGRAIVNHLKKANHQLAAHAKAYPRRNLVRTVVLLNEDQEIYDPAMVVYVLQKALKRMDGDKPRFTNIDAVLYLTERHATQAGRDVAFPILTVPGRGSVEARWKGDVLDYMGRKWSEWNGARFIESEPADMAEFLESFAAVEEIPELMRRQQLWELEYSRNPYMRPWSDEKILDRWDEVVVLSVFSFIKHPPFRLPMAETMKNVERFGNLMQEMAHRGIPVPHKEPSRLMAAAARIGIPQVGLDWLVSQLERPPRAA